MFENEGAVGWRAEIQAKRAVGKGNKKQLQVKVFGNWFPYNDDTFSGLQPADSDESETEEDGEDDEEEEEEED